MWVGREAFSWLLLLLQSRLVLLLQDGLLCKASNATIISPQGFALRFAVQQVVVMSCRCVLHVRIAVASSNLQAKSQV